MSYVEVPPEVIGDRTDLINGVGSGDSNRSLGISDINVREEIAAGSLSKREGGYLQSFVGCSPASPREAGRGGGGVDDQQETALYPVSVTSNNLLNIPGVLDDCGKDDSVYTRKVICSKDPSHFSYTKSGNSCGRPGCPRHWITWARQGADRIGCRITGFGQASRTRYPARKIIIDHDRDDSIVKKWFALDPKYEKIILLRARKYFIARAADMGCIGGSLVVHLWRTNENVPEWIEGQKKWEWVRNKGHLWRDYVKFSPHAHIIGYGYLKPVKKGGKEFLYKNMGPLRTRKEIEAVTFYNLSHAVVGPGVAAVIYFGACSYRMLKPVGKIIKEHYDELCPDCGAVMVFEDSWDSISGQYLRTVERKRSVGIFQICGPPDRGGARTANNI
jgi:hypothetical protein